MYPLSELQNHDDLWIREGMTPGKTQPTLLRATSLAGILGFGVLYYGTSKHSRLSASKKRLLVVDRDETLEPELIMAKALGALKTSTELVDTLWALP